MKPIEGQETIVPIDTIGQAAILADDKIGVPARVGNLMCYCWSYGISHSHDRHAEVSADTCASAGAVACLEVL